MIDILDSTFSYIVDSLLYNCSIRGVKMVAYEKFRNPQTQAVYWKQGRTKDEVTLAIKLLQKDKAFYLIDCIESAEH